MSNIYEQAIEKWGVQAQKLKAIEELSELIKAIAKNDRENIIEEMTDVNITTDQIALIYKITEKEMADKLIEQTNKFKKALDE